VATAKLWTRNKEQEQQDRYEYRAIIWGQHQIYEYWKGATPDICILNSGITRYMNIEQGQHQRYEQNKGNARDKHTNRCNSKDMNNDERAGANRKDMKFEQGNTGDMNIEHGQHQRYEQNKSNTRDKHTNRGNRKIWTMNKEQEQPERYEYITGVKPDIWMLNRNNTRDKNMNRGNIILVDVNSRKQVSNKWTGKYVTDESNDTALIATKPML
jgi:hypothetical protein